MKKLKKMQLKLDREVITSLSNLELVNLKGGEGDIPPAPSVGCPATQEGYSCKMICSGGWHCTVASCNDSCFCKTNVCPIDVPVSEQKSCLYVVCPNP